MKKIKCIVFDFGGVISKRQNIKYIKKICRILNIKLDEFQSLYTQKREDYDTGLIDAKTYWTKTVNLIGKQVSQTDFKKIIEYDVKSWLDINEETISYIQSIKDKSILALLSNMTFDTLQEIGNMYWLDYFQLKIFSCEKKVAKPNPRIYKICLEVLNMIPQQILFVDDSTENIMAAQKMGINTIKFTNCHEIREIIENEYIFIR